MTLQCIFTDLLSQPSCEFQAGLFGWKYIGTFRIVYEAAHVCAIRLI